MELIFNTVQFDIIDRDCQPWIRGYQIGTALGYGDNADVAIRKLYARHADEFSDTMTDIIPMMSEGGMQSTRIFSLRGCHLLAMFARTPVAKAFRRWVLDVLDSVEARRKVDRQADHRPDRCHDLAFHFEALRTKVRQIDGHLADIFRHVRRETFAGSHSARPHALAVNAIHTLDNATTALGYVLTTMERSAHLAVMAARI